MCGIAGIYTYKNNHSIDYNIIVKEMTEKLSHRGPDGINTWFDKKKNICWTSSKLYYNK